MLKKAMNTRKIFILLRSLCLRVDQRLLAPFRNGLYFIRHNGLIMVVFNSNIILRLHLSFVVRLVSCLNNGRPN